MSSTASSVSSAGCPLRTGRGAPKRRSWPRNLTHHIEEEEREMFGQAHRLFDAAAVADLGRRMEDRKASALRTIRSQSHSQAHVA